MKINSFRRKAKQAQLRISDIVRRINIFGKANEPDFNVMTSCGGNNADVVQVLIQSISKLHPKSRINFWFFHISVPNATIDSIKEYCDSTSNIIFHQVKVEETNDFVTMKKLGKKPDSERFLWFIAHQYLPKRIKRVIYIDALDAIVVDDLKPFLNQDFKDRYLIACREINQYSGHAPLHIGPAKDAFNSGASIETIKRVSYGLFNSGSIVLNLDKFRKNNIDSSFYLDIAMWAKNELDLSFGDQGLFSLAHGSNYTLADDRYNYRFFTAESGKIKANPAVIHFAGHARKPFNLRLSEKQEEHIIEYINETESEFLYLNKYHRIWPHYLQNYRTWWDFCKKTPVFNRIRPLAEKATLEALKKMNIHKEADK